MRHNTLKTAVLLAALGALAIAIGDGLGGSGGAAIGLLIGLAIAAGSYWFSDRLAIRAARATPVPPAQMPEYYAIVQDLCRRAQIPMPRLYLSPNPQPNAFATGRNPQHAAVVITQGIVGILTPDELRGVLAHELSHVRNRDILIASVAAAIAMGITFVARLMFWADLFTGGGRGRREGGTFTMLATVLLAPIAAALLQLALSRSREFEADRSGARLIGDGEPLARALEKLTYGARTLPMDVPPAQASMWIVDPMPLRRSSFRKLFMTHPPAPERIARLRAGEWRR
jgi:heat shock protein HtpX